MLRAIRGFVTLVTAFGVALIISVPVVVVLKHITGNDAVSDAIGTGVWLLSGTVILCYLSLGSVRLEPTKAGWQSRPPDKLESAAFRLGFVFAVIGGAVAEITHAPTTITVIAAAACAVVGGLIGYDVQRRFRRLRAGRADEAEGKNHP